jgi:triphosphatase
MLRSKGFSKLMQDLAAWMDVGAWRTRGEPERQAVRDQPIEDFAARVLERRRRKLRQSGRHLDRLSPDGRHRIRIEAKKLRYAAEFFSGLSGDGKHRARYTSLITALEDLQACLGDLNDIETGNEIAAEVAGPEPAAASGPCGIDGTRNHLDEQERRTTALVRSACKAHRRLSAVKPFWKST